VTDDQLHIAMPFVVLLAFIGWRLATHSIVLRSLG